jgi:murein DD-endopeptidase MepM/ murein hydrolase activator NlpD
MVLMLLLTNMFSLSSKIPPIRAEAEQTPTGWYWPAGTGDTGGWLGFMGWNQAFNGWHLAQDFKLDQGLPVYAMADGEVVLSRTDVGGYGSGGTPGGALVARFETSAGESFAALYGHLNNLHAEGKVEAGQILGYTNDLNHLHFGIHPGYELAENPWRGYTHNESETYGWVDPVQFLLNNDARTIPEFPSFLIPPLFILAMLLAIIIYKKNSARA